MPRIEAGDAGVGNGGGGWSIPWRGLGVFALIACSVGYGMYQYEHFFPSRKPAGKAVAAQTANGGTKGSGRNKQEQEIKATFEKLSLSDEQRSQLAAIDSQSTDTRSKFRQAYKVLTAEQRKNFKEARAEARKVAMARAQERRAKFFPSAQDQAYAKAAQKVMREQREARKKAAEQAGGTQTKP